MGWIFHATDRTRWQQAKVAGSYRAETLDSEGFMHCSSADQVAGSLAKHFAGRSDLILLWIEEDAVDSEVKWEESRGGALFPHIYGPLDPAAVRREVLIDVEGIVLP